MNVFREIVRGLNGSAGLCGGEWRHRLNQDRLEQREIEPISDHLSLIFGPQLFAEDAPASVGAHSDKAVTGSVGHRPKFRRRVREPSWRQVHCTCAEGAIDMRAQRVL